MKEAAMKCEDLSQYVVDEIAGEISDEDAAVLHRHLMTCAACRDEVEGLRRTWADLGQLADEEPSPALSERFYTMLEGAASSARQDGPGFWERAGAWLDRVWPRQPAVQLALTAAALVLGVAVGARLGSGPEDTAALRDEIATLNRMVSLSLLDRDSAVDRLQGVSYSARGGGDEEVLAALVRVIDNDDNVNVRLAAVDALAHFAQREPVARELRAALERQQSPMVQAGLLDVLLEINGPESRRTVRDFAQRDDVDPRVREWIEERLQEEGPKL